MYIVFSFFLFLSRMKWSWFSQEKKYKKGKREIVKWEAIENKEIGRREEKLVMGELSCKVLFIMVLQTFFMLLPFVQVFTSVINDV